MDGLILQTLIGSAVLAILTVPTPAELGRIQAAKLWLTDKAQAALAYAQEPQTASGRELISLTVASIESVAQSCVKATGSRSTTAFSEDCIEALNAVSTVNFHLSTEMLDEAALRQNRVLAAEFLCRAVWAGARGNGIEFDPSICTPEQIVAATSASG